MKIVSIEPTPSPNTMKVNVDETLPGGIHRTYRKDGQGEVPAIIRRILAIEGVKSVFHVSDFLAIDRFPNADWRAILAQVREVFGEGDATIESDFLAGSQDPLGEAHVFIQMFRGIPMQVKVVAGERQVRVGLPERFGKTAMEAGVHSTNLVMERKWVEAGVRYGDLQEIGEEVAREIDAAYDENRLAMLKELAAQQTETESVETRSRIKVSPDMLEDPDWRKRYALLEQMDPAEEDLPVLTKALRDTHPSIRRLAVVYLGMVGGKQVLPLLYEALKDPSVSVRRTAGDTLSDLGDPDATEAMVQALQDPNKLVRWRAARFLYEVGNQSALEALKAAQDDPEFEVSLQIKMAIERIESGKEASGTVWQQMTARRQNP
jgi:hypothetical protein